MNLGRGKTVVYYTQAKFSSRKTTVEGGKKNNMNHFKSTLNPDRRMYYLGTSVVYEGGTPNDDLLDVPQFLSLV